MPEVNVNLSLANVCAGQLEEEFQKLYPTLVASLKHGDKAGLTITLELKRVPDTDTMVSVNYRVAPKFPSKSKTSVCQLTGDHKLKTEPPVQKVVSMSLAQSI